MSYTTNNLISSKGQKENASRELKKKSTRPKNTDS